VIAAPTLVLVAPLLLIVLLPMLLVLPLRLASAVLRVKTKPATSVKDTSEMHETAILSLELLDKCVSSAFSASKIS